MSGSKLSKGEIYDAFLEALAEYVIWTSNTEMVFFAFLQLALKDGTATPAVVWFQSQSTRERTEMAYNAFKNRHGSPHAESLRGFLLRFKGLTRQRNFYCHASYAADEKHHYATGYQIIDDDNVIKRTTKRITKGSVNEMMRSSNQLYDLLQEMWAFIESFQNDLIASGGLPKQIVTIQELHVAKQNAQ